MKLEIALGLIAATAFARSGTSAKTTTNECADGEGLEKWPESEEGADDGERGARACFDLYYANGNCEDYLLKADDSCNVWTYEGDVELQWSSASLSANYWKYLHEDEGDEEADNPANDFDDFKARL